MHKVEYDNYTICKHIDQLRFYQDLDSSFKNEGSYNTELNEHSSDLKVPLETIPEPQHSQIKQQIRPCLPNY